MDFTLLGICFDQTQTFRKGAAKAPKLLRGMFQKTEDYASGIDLSEKAFFEDLGDISPKDVKELASVEEKLSGKKFPIVLGGDHAVSFPCVKAVKPKSFLVFDAHPDCNPGKELKHDNVTRKISEIVGAENVFIFGARTFSRDEEEFIKKNKIKLASKKDLKKIPGPIYLSIDLDVLDPSVMQAVGNPEADGIAVKEVLDAVKIVAKKIVAADFVEFTPLGSALDEVNASLAVRLIYSALAEIIKAQEK